LDVEGNLGNSLTLNLKLVSNSCGLAWFLVARHNGYTVGFTVGFTVGLNPEKFDQFVSGPRSRFGEKES
jgi:hypothetical protein